MHGQECGVMGEAELVKDGTCSLLGLFWWRFAKCCGGWGQRPITAFMSKCGKRGIVNASTGFMRIYPACCVIIERLSTAVRTWNAARYIRASVLRRQIGDIFP